MPPQSQNLRSSLKNVIQAWINLFIYGLGSSSVPLTIISGFEDYRWFPKVFNLLNILAAPLALFSSTYFQIQASERERLGNLLCDRLVEEISSYVNDPQMTSAQIEEKIKEVLKELLETVPASSVVVPDQITPTDTVATASTSDADSAVEIDTDLFSGENFTALFREHPELIELYEKWKQTKHTPLGERIYDALVMALFACYVTMFGVAQGFQDVYAAKGGKGNDQTSLYLGLESVVAPAFFIAVLQFIASMKLKEDRSKYPMYVKLPAAGLDFLQNMGTWVTIAVSALLLILKNSLVLASSIAHWSVALSVSILKIFTERNGIFQQFIENPLIAAATGYLVIAGSSQLPIPIASEFFTFLTLSGLALALYEGVRYKFPKQLSAEVARAAAGYVPIPDSASNNAERPVAEPELSSAAIYVVDEENGLVGRRESRRWCCSRRGDDELPEAGESETNSSWWGRCPSMASLIEQFSWRRQLEDVPGAPEPDVYASINGDGNSILPPASPR